MKFHEQDASMLLVRIAHCIISDIEKFTIQVRNCDAFFELFLSFEGIKGGNRECVLDVNCGEFRNLSTGNI